MAMKLNAREKSNDSIIRAYNAQIEKAYKTLGANHTTTRNLVSKAKSIFGASMRTAQMAVGEVPQIKRNRATVTNNNAVKALQKETRYGKQTSKAGQILPMYDVTKAYQKAIQNVQKNILKNLPRDYRMKTPVKQLQKEINRLTTAGAISDQLLENDLASEIWEAYKAAKDKGEDITEFKDFTNLFHSEGQKKALQQYTLESIAEKRNAALVEKALADPSLMDGITQEQFQQYMDGFEDLNPF